jgi:nitrite reductase/ring-hydroxylating ferredoxin subunit
MNSSVREARLPLDEAPAEGSVRMLDIGGHRVGLYRVDDTLYALADRCPHRGAPLCSGRVATPVEARDGALTVGKPRSIVRCPWHKWEYEISTGRCLVDERLRVRTYAVELDGDQIVVSLDRPRPPAARPAAR